MKRLRLALIVVFALMGVGELLGRVLLGLGSPALSIAHPTIEYMFAPDQDVRRFGNRILINEYGMRSSAFSPRRQAGELRIMVFGDSVINGGNLTDQSKLATSLVEHALEERLAREVTIGNISAGSWGPGNWLAYAREFGFFDAQVVALVVSSHDMTDNPTYEALNPSTHPVKRPVSALGELITRYLPRVAGMVLGYFFDSPTDSDAPEPDTAAAQKGLSDLRAFLDLARQSGRHVLVFQHLERGELIGDSVGDGYSRIRELCAAEGITSVSLEPYFRHAIEDGANPYRDNIHPNNLGQQLIARAIEEAVSQYLQESGNQL